MSLKPLSVYIHYPFCKSKCPYCDFNSHVSSQIDYDSFKQAYVNEIEFFANKLKNREIKTIFFGGGTPSLMPIDLVDEILQNLAKNFSIAKNCEISLEANPTSYESAKFLQLKEIGINRLSLGIQALNDDDLKFLGRNHTKMESLATIENAAKIFDNFSFDLIYARPEQRLQNWIDELKIALSFQTKHLSLYQLTIEKGTPFFSDFNKKKFIMPDDELSAQFYEKTNEIMTSNSFEHYEISNYAKKDFECRHNLAYWNSDDYVGIGAGAHSRAFFDDDDKKSALMMKNDPKNWLKSALENGNAIQNLTKITQNELLEEVVLMGLRLKNGIKNSTFQKNFQKNIVDIFDLEKLSSLKSLDLIYFDKNSIKITQKGRILSNSIIEKVIDCALPITR
jgi:oxygen-independent coproporphyrinogen-3 oxidase